MNWKKAGVYSFVGGFALGFVVDVVLLATGDCGIGAVAKGIFFGIPIGNVVGIGVYRKLALKSLTMSDIGGAIAGLILSACAVLGGLYVMDAIDAMPGLLVGLFGSCLCSLLGYAVGLRILTRHKQR